MFLDRCHGLRFDDLKCIIVVFDVVQKLVIAAGACRGRYSVLRATALRSYHDCYTPLALTTTAAEKLQDASAGLGKLLAGRTVLWGQAQFSGGRVHCRLSTASACNRVRGYHINTILLLIMKVIYIYIYIYITTWALFFIMVAACNSKIPLRFALARSCVHTA